jgi:hypothetical protein
VPSIAYGTSTYLRTGFPPLTLINMFLEQAKSSENQVALLSRPGLVQSYAVGSGPINAVFSKKGTFGGDIFSVSNNTLYRNTSSLGNITGTGPVSIDGSDNEVVVTRGGTAYSYNGTNLAAIAFPDGANVRAVCFINGRFVFARDATAKFYWSDILDGRTIDPLNFATAERQPDHLLDVIARGDILWLLGEATIEAWSNDGSSADIPFSRIEQVVFDDGTIATGATVLADNTIFTIRTDGTLSRMAEVLERVSDHSIEQRILASATHKLFTYTYQGHEMIAARLADETILYDCATREFCEFQTSQGNWIASCATMTGDEAVFGHDTTGQVMVFSGWADLGNELERRFPAAHQLDRPTVISSLKLWANTGTTELLSGQGSDPTVEMRSSDDAGNTWGEWEPDSLGVQGEYRAVPEWRALGMFDFPGALFEFRVTDPVDFRVSAVKVNDPLGGRERGS